MLDMSTLLPLDLSTIIAILLFTFLFDLIDLKPQIGSFSFLWGSFTYFTYYSLRVIFGILAAILLQTTGIFQHPFLLAFAAVVAAVSTLESFTLKIGGHEVADLSSLFDNYRTKMINDELDRAAQISLAQQMQLVHDLVDKRDKDSLRASCLACLRALHHGDPNPTDTIDGKMKEIDKIGGSDDYSAKMLLAMEIVYINPEYAKMLLEKE